MSKDYEAARMELWKAVVLTSLSKDMVTGISASIHWADTSVEEFDKRFNESMTTEKKED